MLPAGTALPGTSEALSGASGGGNTNAAGEFTALGSIGNNESKGAPDVLSMVRRGETGEGYEAHKNMTLADRRRVMRDQGQLSAAESQKIKKARQRANQSTRNFLRAVEGDAKGVGDDPREKSGSGGGTPHAASPRIGNVLYDMEGQSASALESAKKAVDRRTNRRGSTGGMPTGAAGRGRRRASVDLAVERRRQGALGAAAGSGQSGQLSEASKKFTSNLSKTGKMYARHRRASAAAARAPHVRGRRASTDAQAIDAVRRAKLLAEAMATGGSTLGKGGPGTRRASTGTFGQRRRSTAATRAAAESAPAVGAPHGGVMAGSSGADPEV